MMASMTTILSSKTDVEDLPGVTPGQDQEIAECPQNTDLKGKAKDWHNVALGFSPNGKFAAVFMHSG